jgi:hypothetical protein
MSMLWRMLWITKWMKKLDVRGNYENVEEMFVGGDIRSWENELGRE